MDFHNTTKAGITSVRNLYGRFEWPISSLSLIGGFVFDILTLQRVDMFWENFWVIGHLLIVAVFIVLINVQNNSGRDETDPSKAHFWYVNVLQFFFGGLLSTFLVFYFRSADLTVSWAFILLLALAFWANESLKRKYAKLSFQISLFFICLFSFAIFFIPILVHSIGPYVFLLSGVVSLMLIFVFVYILARLIGEKFYESSRFVSFSILGIFLLINFLYFMHVIPPIPLSLRDGGVYHSIQKNAEGNYNVSYEDIGWRKYIVIYEDIHIRPIDSVIAYSAVFSPTSFNTTIVHQWQYYDEIKKEWINSTRVLLSVTGGRDGGYRTYSTRSGLSAGYWRINIETPRGEIIGRLRFNIVLVDTPVHTSTKINF